MNDLTCIIIGGGHVGLAALKAIQGATRDMANGRRIRFVLIDKQSGHVRKVMLFRPGKIVKADLEGHSAPVHKSMMCLFGIGLGLNRGLVWVRKRGLF